MKYKNESYKIYCPDCKKISKFTEWLDRGGGYLQGVICGFCGSDRQQKDPPSYYCYPYKKRCVCGKEHILLTQKDDFPEYYHDVGVVCECGEAVFFSLPVN